MKNAEYYIDNPEEFNELTDDERAAVLADSGNVDADDLSDSSNSVAEDSVEASEDADSEVVEAQAVEQIPPKTDTSNVDDLKTLVSQQAKLIEALEAAQKKDTQDGGTENVDSVIDEYMGDFPEIYNEMSPFIQKMIDRGVKSELGNFSKLVDEKLKALTDSYNTIEIERHYNTIAKAHPDWKNVVNSEDFKKWPNTLPSFVKDSVLSILDGGTATQINDVLSAYKEANKKPQLVQKPNKTATNVTTLTDVPGKSGPIDENILNMSPERQESYFMGKSPDEILKTLNRLL